MREGGLLNLAATGTSFDQPEEIADFKAQLAAVADGKNDRIAKPCQASFTKASCDESEAEEVVQETYIHAFTPRGGAALDLAHPYRAKRSAVAPPTKAAGGGCDNH